MPIQVFGQGAVQTAYVGRVKINLTSDLTLFWPSSYQNTPNTTAEYIDVYSVAAPGFSITLPDATQVSVGQNFIIRNGGANSFTLRDNAGNSIGTIAVGISYYYLLDDNSTAAGAWIQTTFGAGTSQADPIALAGKGLIADGSKLDTNIPVVSNVVGPTYNVTSANNAGLVVWEGGAGTINLPDPSTLAQGFYFSVNNSGSGFVVINGNGKDINGLPDFTLGLSQSVTLIANTTEWWTLGFNKEFQSSISVLNKNVVGNSNVTLTDNEAAYPIIQFVGALTGNITVFFPNIQAQWTISNQTTGAFNLNVQLVGPTGTSYNLPQNNSQIYYNDGLSLHVVPTYQSLSISFSDGTVSSPSIAFAANLDTGLYRSGLNQIGFTAGGNQVLVLGTASASFDTPVDVPIGSQIAPTFTFDGDSSTGMYSAGAGNVSFSTAGSRALSMTSTIIQALRNIQGPNGAVATPAFSFTSDPSTGMYSTGAGNLSLGAGNSQVVSMTNTAITISKPLTLTTPLPIASGGTNASTQANAIINLMPAAVSGNIVYFNGTNWIVLAPGSNYRGLVMASNVPSWSGISTLQNLSFVQTTSFQQALTTTFATVGSFSIPITLANASNNVFINATIVASVATNNARLALYRGATRICIFGPLYSSQANIATTVSVEFVDTPGAVGPFTYTVQASTSAAGGTLNINRDNANTLSGFTSTFYLSEVGT